MGLPTPDTIAIDVYPDTSGFDTKSLCKLPEATIDGKPAYVFSSYRKDIVEAHFVWMQQYSIDGALVQRFINSIPGLRRENDTALRNIQGAAEDHNRRFAVEYDLIGSHPDTVLDQLGADWNYLRQSGFLNSKAYLHFNGKPVVSI